MYLGFDKKKPLTKDAWPRPQTWSINLVPQLDFQSVFDNVLLEHAGLPHVLPLGVHLIFFYLNR